ncbi:DNA mismatch repair endonuclease MutL [Candidatus Woesearchaeota archaeon]|nr:DNA mismatch repair endonuclease MutL [Candidatus Woesearchaeota archaeon]
MPHIHLLSEDLINKIAAGEVIERPASVVKELIENSLDAQSTKILIDIENYGQNLIKIADNGQGMDEEDAKKSLLRHATSKIQNADDLLSIQTLGFRGEALASIAAVSKLILKTKQPKNIAGIEIEVEAGKILRQSPAGMDDGTTMEVHHLFFNTPARKKFLKSDQVELRHIIDVVTRYALVNHTITFTLKHNSTVLLHSPSSHDPRSTIAALYGISTAKELLEVNCRNNDISISGFISTPYNVRNDKSQQFLYINRRWVRNEDVNTAIYDAYHSALFVNRHPLYILNLTLPPEKIDVNVHPAKTEVKIEQKEIVQKEVFFAVKKTLQKHNLIPAVDLNVEQHFFPAKKQKYAYEQSVQTALPSEDVSEPTLVKEPKAAYAEQHTVQNTVEEQPLLDTQRLPALKLLGQIHKTFFVAEAAGGVVFIDQHAAHERVCYEKLMKQFIHYEMQVQQLLQGELLELTPLEKAFVQDQQEMLKRFGFTLEPFGENTFVLKTIPALLGRTYAKEMFYDLLASLRQGKNRLETIKEDIITRMACRAAVMAGEVLANIRMEQILADLSQTDFPYTCPHGRPTIIKTDAEELEKKFRRK